MRILGLDFGSKTVGVAVSDPTGLIASGVEIIRRDREDKLRKTEEFKEMLVRRTGLPVDFMDERLSTVEAIELMNEAGIAGKDRKEYVDKIAATFILQWYLDEKNSEGK